MEKKKLTILVTGGAGYIGSHAALDLEKAGYRVVVLDNLSRGHRDLVEKNLRAELVVGDIGDRALVGKVLAGRRIDAVMHFAAFALVGESMEKPDTYYRNNVAGTLSLLEGMADAGVKKLVFSSTCAIYGEPETVPIPEDHPRKPINPYGAGKLMVERMLPDFERAYGLKTVSFRYFNAAGADPGGMLGEDHDPETHLVPLALLTALGRQKEVRIFGTDYPTPDRTCIRDYIHVSDLSRAHLLGLEYLLADGDSAAFNLGTGRGYSVREVIGTAQRVTGRRIRVMESARRPGDPPVLVSRSEKAGKALGWTPEYPDLERIIDHAWAWHSRRHG